MRSKRANNDIGIDANGYLTETVALGNLKVVLHYADLPESDITTVDGLRVTTPIRTVIDLAPELSAPELERVIKDCLDRGLFTVEEALARIARPDMATRLGAHIVRRSLLP